MILEIALIENFTITIDLKFEQIQSTVNNKDFVSSVFTLLYIFVFAWFYVISTRRIYLES